MSENYKEQIKTLIINPETFIRATFSKKMHGSDSPWHKVRVRPIELKNQRHLQFSYLTETQDITKNHVESAVNEPLEELLNLPFKNIHIQTTKKDIHVRLTTKGKALIREGKASVQEKKPLLTHDRKKERMIPIDEPNPFLHAVGIMTKDGKIKANMQSKFRQIDEFLRLIRPVVVDDKTAIQQSEEKESATSVESANHTSSPLQIVDLGCGNAYLTFAVYYYFHHILNRPINMIGVDVRGDLLQKHAQTAQALGWRNLHFETKKIIDFEPKIKPDIVMALHACDTATDEALALGVQWQSQFIFSAPCCHHHLQQQLNSQPMPSQFRPVSRHGILSERMGDILTDTLRASILRGMGYQTDVVEFVPTEHTPRNLLIRAARADRMKRASYLEEYQLLKEFWQVTPYLEQLLANEFQEWG